MATPATLALSGRMLEAGVSRAGTIVQKPVIGRKVTRIYEEQVERGGKVVKAQVIEETNWGVPGWAAGLGAIVLVVGSAIVIADITGTAAASSDYLQAQKEKRKKKREEAKVSKVQAQIASHDYFGAAITNFFG